MKSNDGSGIPDHACIGPMPIENGIKYIWGILTADESLLDYHVPIIKIPNGYTITDVLGYGVCSYVYQAECKQLNYDVAIKVIYMYICMHLLLDLTLTHTPFLSTRLHVML